MEKKNIHSALLDFQMLGISIKKGSTNPHFKNKYADLDEILAKVKAPLNKLGVYITQLPQMEGLETVLRHVESDSEIKSIMPYTQKSDAQKLGGNITYAKRQSLIAMLGLEEEDDDANKAVARDPEVTIEQAFSKIQSADSVDSLTAIYKALPVNLQKDAEVIALAGEIKKKYV